MKIVNTLLDMLFGHSRRQFVSFDPQCFSTVGRESILDLHAFLNELKPLDDEEASMFETAAATGMPSLFEAWLSLCLLHRGAYDHFYVLPLRGRRNRDWIQHLERGGWRISTLSTSGEMTEVYSLMLQNLRQVITLAYEMPEGFNDAWRQVTLTFGPVPWHPYSVDEPLHRATRRAVREGITVVVAAGNEGRLIKGNSLNPWCCAPWLISVGATDKIGQTVLPESSRGVPGLDYEAPTVVAPGVFESHSGLNHVHSTAIENIRTSPPGTVETAVDGDRVYLYNKREDGQITIQMILEDGSQALKPRSRQCSTGSSRTRDQNWRRWPAQATQQNM